MNFNPMDILKNASSIQAKMEVIDVKISPDAIDASDPSMTEQLVKAACTDAYNKMKQKINEEFGNYH